MRNRTSTRQDTTPPPPEKTEPRATAPLEDEFTEPTRTAPPSAAPKREVVKSANQLQLGQGFDAIIDTVFDFDAEAAYATVKKALKLDVTPTRADYGILVNALDEAAEHSREALQLAANAEYSRVAFDAEADTLESAMRESAVKALKEEGATKMTIADIEARMFVMFHDEVRELRERRAKAKSLVGYLEGLAKIAGERQRDLRQMVASARNA